jgi:hypothetical protein
MALRENGTIAPLINWLPELPRSRARSRVYRWYGELALLERDVERWQGDLPIGRWLADLDRIEHAASHIRVPKSMASDGCALREYIGRVRRAIFARREGTSPIGGR